MSTTRSPFPPAPATELLIVSHGSPSEPMPQEAFVERLADAVATRTGGRVRGATLALPGSLDAAVAGLAHPLVFPHFMTDGWFVSTNLPKQLREAGLESWTALPPLGLHPELAGIALGRLTNEMQAAGLPAEGTTLVVAAHGSPSDPRPAAATERFARALRASDRFRCVQVGYVDESPVLETAARIDGPAMVLPFFAARAGHVLIDLPEALDAAGFDGLVLPPIGTWAEIPSLIAGAARQHAKAA